MDRNFDFSALLTQTHENKHKFKPSQFRSVAGGVKKRLDSNIENKRRTRLTNFDSFRNIPVCQTPEPKPLTKIEQRMLQLKKWKEEKAKKKAEAMAKKKKPFVVGVAKDTLQFGPPPPVVFPLPSTSGRVTRSQNQKLYNFAPQNAVFNPKLQNLDIPKSLNNAPKSLNNASKSLNNAPKSLNNTRSLRSKKLTEVSSAVENATIPKIQVSRKPSKPTKSKLISNSTSSSGSTDSHHDGSKPVTKVTISAKKMRNTKKGKISASTTKKRRISKIVASTNNDKLVDLSNSTSMEIEVKKALNSSKMFIPNTEETPNKPQQIVQDFITFTPKNPVPKSESSSEEKLRSPKVIDVPMTPQEIQEEVKMISPRVCLSRGKDNTRKEMKKKIADGLLDEDICDMSVGHFRRQLNSEITRMTEMCEVWDNTLEQETVPDEIQEAVQSAVGQARLLMSQKLQQFASLLRRCEQPEPGQMLVNRTDLQGFWDMVFLQIDDVDIRFKKLEQSRARGWSAEEPAATAALKKKPPQPKPAQSKPAARAPTAANSRLKDIIAAARKAKQAKSDATKTFEAGFFRIQSPVKSPAAATPAATPARQRSMLQSVLSCEAQKASCKQASYAMLRASLLAKSVDGDPSYEANLVPSTPINLGLTPGKSILKCNNNSSMKVASKQLQFMLASSASSVSSDATSESGPAADHGQISGVEKLPDMDSSQNSSPAQLKNSQIQNLANSDAEDNSHIAAEGKRNRRSSRRSVRANVEDNLLTDSGNSTEGKRNRRSSRSSVKPNAEDLLIRSENIQEETKNKRSSRRSVRSNVEDNLVSKDSEKIAEDKENKHSSRRSARSKPEDNLLTTDSEKIAEDKENRRSSRKSARSKHEDNLLATDSENYAEEMKNRRSSRRSVTPNVEDNLASTDSKKFADDNENIVSSRRSARLKRQDAVEIMTPRSTRSRRKAV